MEQFIAISQAQNIEGQNSTPIIRDIEVPTPSNVQSIYRLPPPANPPITELDEHLQQINNQLSRIEEKMQGILDLLMSQAYTIQQTQSILGDISYNTVKKLIANGQLEQVHSEKGNRILITSKSIHAYINNTDKRRAG